MHTKKQLRKELLRKRQMLSAEFVVTASKQATRHLIEVIDWKVAKRIHIYLPLPGANEIDTYEFLDYVWKNHPEVEVFVPIMDSSYMASALLQSNTPLIPSTFGVPVPKAAKHVNDVAFNYTILPMIGFDKNFHRIGYGAGYYDRFLSQQPSSKTIGLAYDCTLVTVPIPIQPHDQQLDVVITESKKFERKHNPADILNT